VKAEEGDFISHFHFQETNTLKAQDKMS